MSTRIHLGAGALVVAFLLLIAWLGSGMADAGTRTPFAAEAPDLALGPAATEGAVPTAQDTAGAADAASAATGTAGAGSTDTTQSRTTQTQTAQTPTEPAPTPAELVTLPAVDPAWVEATAGRAGVPARALTAYGSATLAVSIEQPSCHLGWTTLAAIGAVESGHGTHGGSTLLADGTASVPIYGPSLDGGAYARVGDSDGGAVDADPRGDRAVGPFQFIPSTWARWGADGDGDGRRDPQDVDDAALAAGRYLCNAGDLADAATWRAAVFSYNHDSAYVDQIARVANGFPR